LHCFGHVHDEHGISLLEGETGITTAFSNAAMDIFRTANVINFEYSTAGTLSAPAPDTPAGAVGPFWIRTGDGHVVDIDADPAAKNQRVWLWKKLRPAANQLWYALPSAESQVMLASALSHPLDGSAPRCLYAVRHRIRALTRGEADRMDKCNPLLLPLAVFQALQQGPVSWTVGHMHVALDPRTSELILQEDAEPFLMELEHCRC